MNSSFGAHQAAVAAAHRQAITGVYQWIQPAGFWVKADGSVSFPPDENTLAATAPLLAMGLESGVCTSLAPGSLESGGALRAIPALVAAAEKFNVTSYIVDLEYPAGSNRQGVQGAHLDPLGLFLRTSILFIWRILSAFLRA